MSEFQSLLEIIRRLWPLTYDEFKDLDSRVRKTLSLNISKLLSINEVIPDEMGQVIETLIRYYVRNFLLHFNYQIKGVSISRSELPPLTTFTEFRALPFNYKRLYQIHLSGIDLNNLPPNDYPWYKKLLEYLKEDGLIRWNYFVQPNYISLPDDAALLDTYEKSRSFSDFAKLPDSKKREILALLSEPDVDPNDPEAQTLRRHLQMCGYELNPHFRFQENIPSPVSRMIVDEGSAETIGILKSARSFIPFAHLAHSGIEALISDPFWFPSLLSFPTFDRDFSDYIRQNEIQIDNLIRQYDIFNDSSEMYHVSQAIVKYYDHLNHFINKLWDLKFYDFLDYLYFTLYPRINEYSPLTSIFGCAIRSNLRIRDETELAFFIRFIRSDNVRVIGDVFTYFIREPNFNLKYAFLALDAMKDRMLTVKIDVKKTSWAINDVFHTFKTILEATVKNHPELDLEKITKTYLSKIQYPRESFDVAEFNSSYYYPMPPVNPKILKTIAKLP